MAVQFRSLRKLIFAFITMLSAVKALLRSPPQINKRVFIPTRTTSRLFSNRSPISDADAASKYFEFDRLEKEIYKWWEDSGYFKPSTDLKKKQFVIPMPPPNVTGFLHMGHALFVALQDIMTRFQRMRGKSALWLPGTDHAGIATQLVVEKALVAEGISRQSLGRQVFLDRVWQWKEEKGGYITQQMRRLGASADWSRERFTLEADMSTAVIHAFVTLYERGLVYKGDYLVNWSPFLQTAVSDLEVEYSEEMGTLYYFKYELADGSGFIPVATTRPETVLGDTAVCVNPNDERYQPYIGKMVKVPMSDRTVPVIADDYVDKEFGTGAVKITPAHDPNDYEIGKRHQLPMISIMNKDATINSQGGASYTGLSREACRKQLWADMEAGGLAIKAVPHMQRVPRSQRGGEVIEPMVSGQWFVKMDNMAARAVRAVREKEIEILPERFEKVWYGWLENIRDWCVSRQLWWGHRIPAYYVVGGQGDSFVVARTEEEAYAKAREQYGPDVALVQDEDVLDTWFSSGLWPFATVGWPAAVPPAPQSLDPASDYARFYPASVLETGYDILFFWVARMVMMGLEFTDKSPFHTIYMHGLVRDGEGQKMSKSKGNVIDPLDTMDQYGCDSLRYSLVTGTSPGQVNKLWNVGKYIHHSLSGLSPEERAAFAAAGPISADELASLPLPEKFIVTACNDLVTIVTDLLEKYNFGEAGRLIYEFLWNEFADWYIEVSKTRMRDPERAKVANRVLTYVWETCLRLLHPFMPFITESLWQLAPHSGESIMMTDWPLLESAAALPTDPVAVKSFRSMQSLVTFIRNARAEYNTQPGKKLAALIRVSTATDTNLLDGLKSELPALALLGRLNEPDIQIIVMEPGEFTPPETLGACIHLVVEDGLDAFIPLSDMIDYEKETQRLKKQAEKLQKDINGLEARLSSDGFKDRAPPEIFASVTGSLKEKKDQLVSVQNSLAGLKKN